MSKRIMSALIASTVFAPVMPVYAQTTALADTILANQLDEVNDVLTDVSDIVNQSMNSIEIENKPQVEEVTYVYYEAPVDTPVIYYETVSVEHLPVIQSVDNALVEENVPNEAYPIALANYEDALAVYNAACELVETTKEVEVETVEEVEDDQGNVTTVTRTEIQTITETSYAGDVDAAKAALDAAAAVLEQTPQFLTETKEEVAEEESVIVSSEEAVSETAFNAAADNQCGDDATWTLSNMGDLKISGTGAIYDYTNSEHAPWFSQKLMVNTVTIESGITKIGNYAFDQCDRITSVIIGDTVTEIGKYAFNRNFALTEVVIPDSVTYIDNYAFNWCNNVKTVELGTGLVTISTQAFYECEALETIVIPSNVKTIGNGAFKECVSLRSITLNEGLQKIGASVFSGCISLTSIDIPSTVTSIGNNIFAACASLMSINVDNQNMNYSSLDGVLYDKSKTTLIQCPSGKSSISIPESVTEIGDSAFYECNLPSIKLPENVTSIGTHAFYRCRALTEMILPDSLTTLGTSAFSMCRNLIYLDLGNSLTAVPNSAFYTCYNMTTIVLPNTLTSIASDAFSKCLSLTDVYYRGTESDWIDKALYDFGDDVTMHYMADYVMDAKHSLSLSGNIGVNFYFLFSDEILADADAKVEFTIDGNTSTVFVKDARKTKINNQYYRIFSADVTSVQMTTDIHAKVSGSMGYIGYEEAYTVKEYCDQSISTSSDAELVQLMKDLLNYGGYAQTCFNYNTENLANADLEDIDVSDVTAQTLVNYASQETGSEEGLNYSNSSLILDSLTTINHIFTVSSGHTIDEYEFMLGDEVLTPIKRGNRYYIEISNISSKDLDQPYTVRVGDFEITYSALSYAYKALTSDAAGAELKDACRALYKYNQSADAYFG